MKSLSQVFLILWCMFFLSFESFAASTPTNIEMAQQEVTEEERQDISIHNYPLASKSAGLNLEGKRDDWLKGNGQRAKRHLGFDRNGSYIGWMIASIEADPKRVDFGQKRIMAFEKAFIDAKGEFVRAKKQKIAVTVSRKFLHVDLKEKDVELKDGRFVGIGKKIAALTEAKLDKALIDLGVDPKDIANSDIKDKRPLLENSISKEINVEAIQSIMGVRILATFEDTNGVGVLIKQNRNTRDLASAIASRKLVGYPSKTDPATDITNQLEQKFTENRDYITQYGVRVMADEVGNRVLVSFGQWSPKVTRSDSKMKINMAVKAAKEIAYNNALSYMAQFIKTALNLKDKSVLKDSDTIDEIIRTGNAVEETENSVVGASIDKFIKENSNWTCEGCAETIDWSVNHPDTGHLIVGKVLMWSPLTQEYARQKPTQRQILSNSPNEVRKINSEIRTSVDIGNDDF